MNEPRGSSDELEFTRAAALLAGDLEALRNESRRDMPSLDTTAPALHRPARSLEGVLTMTMRNLRSRPWWMAAATAAVIALALLFVPLSYQRTVGQEVTLTLADPNVDRATVERVAGALRTALGSQDMRVTRGDQVTLQARVPARSAAEVARITGGLARTLGQQGISAHAAIAPWTEKVSGNVYALTANLVLRIPIEGRTAAEIEQDARAQLEGAGIADPQVHVSRDGDRTEIQIDAEKGTSGAGDHQVIKIQEKSAGDVPELNVQLFDTDGLKGKSDAEIKTEIERQLCERGVEGTVTVEHGKVKVEARKEVHN